MPFEISNLPISGGALMAGVTYVVASLLITGPIVGERMIERSGWAEQCSRALRSSLILSRPAPPVVPKLDCNSILGIFGGDGQALCNHYGNPSLGGPLMDQLDEQRRRVEKLKKKRLAAASAKVGPRCECAVSVLLEQSRVPLAIYAGSARLVTPRVIKNLHSELTTNLHSPLCAAKSWKG